MRPNRSERALYNSRSINGNQTWFLLLLCFFIHLVSSETPASLFKLVSSETLYFLHKPDFLTPQSRDLWVFMEYLFLKDICLFETCLFRDLYFFTLILGISSDMLFHGIFVSSDTSDSSRNLCSFRYLYFRVDTFLQSPLVFFITLANFWFLQRHLMES